MSMQLLKQPLAIVALAVIAVLAALVSVILSAVPDPQTVEATRRPGDTISLATRPLPADADSMERPTRSIMSTEQAQHRSGESPLVDLEPLLGDWSGSLISMWSGKEPVVTPLYWHVHPAFDGRYIRFEFWSHLPGASGRHVEYEGLFTWNDTTQQIESIWMSPNIRSLETRFLDGRFIFFEKGRFDDSRTTLTLLSKQQHGPDDPEITVRSTFRILGKDHFTIHDERFDEESGQWQRVGTFDMRRR